MLAKTSNIVGCYRLRPFAHPVACFCVLLGVVAQILRPVNLLESYVQTDATTFNIARDQQCQELLRPPFHLALAAKMRSW